MSRARICSLIRTLPVLFLMIVEPDASNAQVCGNGAVEGDELCDDGNVFGADGCASNCTNETKYGCKFGEPSNQTLFTSIFTVPFPLRGGMLLSIGGVRLSEANGHRPIAVGLTDVTSSPATLPGIGVLCLVGDVRPEGGPNSGVGTIGCGPNGLPDVNYQEITTRQISNTSISFTGSGGQASMTLRLSIRSYSVVGNPNQCFVGLGDPNRAEGADGVLCTADDPNAIATAPQDLRLTTGTALGRLLPGTSGEPTLERAESGRTIPCDALDGNPRSALDGLALVAAQTALARPQLGDLVSTTRVECIPLLEETPTPTCTLVPSRTPTPTLTAIEPTPTVTNTPRSTDTPEPPSPTLTTSNTPTMTSIATQTPPQDPSPSPTLPAPPCSGDCNTDGQVSIDELIRAVNIALGSTDLNTCVAVDFNHNAEVSVDELVRAVNAALSGCGS